MADPVIISLRVQYGQHIHVKDTVSRLLVGRKVPLFANRALSKDYKGRTTRDRARAKGDTRPGASVDADVKDTDYKGGIWFPYFFVNACACILDCFRAFGHSTTIPEHTTAIPPYLRDERV